MFFMSVTLFGKVFLNYNVDESIHKESWMVLAEAKQLETDRQYRLEAVILRQPCLLK